MADGPYTVATRRATARLGHRRAAAAAWLDRLRAVLDRTPASQLQLTPYADPDVESLSAPRAAPGRAQLPAAMATRVDDRARRPAADSTTRLAGRRRASAAATLRSAGRHGRRHASCSTPRRPPRTPTPAPCRPALARLAPARRRRRGAHDAGARDLRGQASRTPAAPARRGDLPAAASPRSRSAPPRSRRRARRRPHPAALRRPGPSTPPSASSAATQPSSLRPADRRCARAPVAGHCCRPTAAGSPAARGDRPALLDREPTASAARRHRPAAGRRLAARPRRPRPPRPLLAALPVAAAARRVVGAGAGDPARPGRSADAAGRARSTRIDARRRAHRAAASGSLHARVRATRRCRSPSQNNLPYPVHDRGPASARSTACPASRAHDIGAQTHRPTAASRHAHVPTTIERTGRIQVAGPAAHAERHAARRPGAR